MRMRSEPTSFPGRCHCGNLELTFETSLRPEELSIRTCACSFCRSHGARNTSDPRGSVRITIHDPRQLIRYRFALKTADFLICGHCGVYVAAVLQAGDRSYATVNTNALDDLGRFKKEPITVNYDGESQVQRIARRKANWTPVVSFNEGGA